jgi:replicative DNA helicase
MKPIKQLPQAIEIEDAILGILLDQPKALHSVISKLPIDAFYSHKNQVIYNAISEQFSASRPTDLISINSKLQAEKKLDAIGGINALMDLTIGVVNTASLDYYCEVVSETYKRRLGIVKATELVDKLYGGDEMVDNLSLANELTLSLSNETSNVGGIHISNSLIELIREQEMELNGEFSGCKSGFKDLDKQIIGFKNQQVVIVAGRPGMGKTTFGINIAYRLAKHHNTPVGFFSLEMSHTELTKKFAAIEAQISNSRINELDEDKLHEYFRKAQAIGTLPIHIDDKPNASIDDIRARAITMKRRHDIKLLVIDYIQLINVGKAKGNREQEISEISRKIKLLAKELNIPIIAIAQLSRQVEASDPKIPFLHHLRESGSIEQDADMVLMLWRAEYYDYPEFEFDSKMEDSKGKCVCFIRKNRNGETGRVLFRNNLTLSSFYDINVDNFIPPNLDF